MESKQLKSSLNITAINNVHCFVSMSQLLHLCCIPGQSHYFLFSSIWWRKLIKSSVARQWYFVCGTWQFWTIKLGARLYRMCNRFAVFWCLVDSCTVEQKPRIKPRTAGDDRREELYYARWLFGRRMAVGTRWGQRVGIGREGGSCVLCRAGVRWVRAVTSPSVGWVFEGDARSVEEIISSKKVANNSGHDACVVCLKLSINI